MLQAGQEILPYMLYLPPWVWDENSGRTALAMDNLKNRTQFKYPDHSENSPINMTSTNPSNTSEWQLYRVLQRANLLQYYDVFIAQGGDDVQQLCEAGEEEFLEIMALVGMASKPLHVRRLQKSLQEWVSNPGGFQGPMVPMGGSSSPAPGSITAAVREQYPVHSSSVVTAPTWTPQMPPASVSPTNSNSSSGASPKSDLKDESALLGMMYQSSGPDGLPITPKQSTSPVPTPVLVESQIQAIADAAERLAKELPPFEPKGLNTKKTINREIQAVVNMTEDDPCRMDELRKYAAIYGRFDSKRKNHKPMSLHEISVNEASAQLCKHIPALLTRREDLFPLARQVVRDSGYQYSKGHSRGSNEPPSIKKLKMDPVFQRLYDNSQKTVKAEMDKLHREERMSAIQSELEEIYTARDELKSRVQIAKDSQDYNVVHNVQAELENLMSRQVQLLSEQNDMAVKQQKYEKYIQIISKGTGSCYGDDEFDSSNLPSGASSPHNSLHDVEEFDTTKPNIYTGLIRRNNPKSKQVVKETLFDEGLRIAQQYGMADFAEELKGLQQGIVVEDEEDDNIDVENTECTNVTEAKGQTVPDRNGRHGEKESSAQMETGIESDRISPGFNGRAMGDYQSENKDLGLSDQSSVAGKHTTQSVNIETEEDQINRQTNAQVTLITNGISHTGSRHQPVSPSKNENSNIVQGDRVQYMSSDNTVSYRNIEGLPAYAAKSFVQKELTYSQ